MTGSGGRRPQVYLHIGPPKTGTTFLQETLRHWHRDLHKAGVLFPRNPNLDHFGAALDARGDLTVGMGHSGGIRKDAVGAWSRLVRRASAASGKVVISHELFSTADDEHAKQAVADLERCDLHIVVTARDPARQIVSSWQQRIKQGGTQDFADIERRVARRRRLSSSQDLPALLERWGSSLPPENVHLVTVPQSSSDPNVLWTRFASVIGVDAAEFPPPATMPVNPALGVAEVELLRRVNVELDGRISHPPYGEVVTRMFARRVLSVGQSSPKSMLPASLAPVADEIAERWISEITAAGYDVTGDLSDLRPAHRPGPGPRDAEEPEVSAAGVSALAELLVEVARRRSRRGIARRAAVAALELRGKLGRRSR